MKQSSQMLNLAVLRKGTACFLGENHQKHPKSSDDILIYGKMENN